MNQILSLSGFNYRCQISGRRTRVRTPILFLSGAFQTMRSWERFESVFGRQTQVLLVDLPGAGDSDILPSRYGLDFLSDAVRHLLDVVGLERVYLVASSYGSPIAYRFAQEHPKRVSALVLAGVMRTIPEQKRESIVRTLELLERGRLDEFARLVVSGLLCRDSRRPVRRRRVAERMLLRGLTHMDEDARDRYITNSERLLRHDPLDLSAPPKATSLVFTGEHDVFTTAEQCREMSRLMGSWFTTIRRADHLFHLEQFETTVELLMRFATGRIAEGVPGCTPMEAFQRRDACCSTSRSRSPSAENLRLCTAR